MDSAAHAGNENAYKFADARVKDAPLDFSFSGLKTSAVNALHTANQKSEEINSADFAASFTKAVVKAISSRIELLIEDKGKFHSGKLALAGGVAANSHLRAELESLCKKHGVKLYLPPKHLCGDNGVMVGAQGYYDYIAVPENERKAAFSNLALNAYATKDCDKK